MAQKMRSNEQGEKEDKKERKINLPKEPLIHKGFALCEKKRAVKEEEKLQLREPSKVVKGKERFCFGYQLGSKKFVRKWKRHDVNVAEVNRGSDQG